MLGAPTASIGSVSKKEECGASTITGAYAALARLPTIRVRWKPAKTHVCHTHQRTSSFTTLQAPQIYIISVLLSTSRHYYILLNTMFCHRQPNALPVIRVEHAKARSGHTSRRVHSEAQANRETVLI